MNLQDFESKLVELLDQGNLDEAESLKLTVTPWLKGALSAKNENGIDLLNLLAQVAGDAESYSNFCDLLDDLLKSNLITNELENKLLKSSPANRWM